MRRPSPATRQDLDGRDLGLGDEPVQRIQRTVSAQESHQGPQARVFTLFGRVDGPARNAGKLSGLGLGKAPRLPESLQPFTDFSQNLTVCRSYGQYIAYIFSIVVFMSSILLVQRSME